MKRLWRFTSITTVLTTLVFVAQPTAYAAVPSLSVLHYFNGNDGWMPQSGLVQGTDGALYGTTSQGGVSVAVDPLGQGYGTVFRLDANTKTFSTLKNFTNTNGAKPYSDLLVGKDGSLYGTTYVGGLSNLGTLYRIDENGNNFSTLRVFVINDLGVKPDDLHLIEDGSGKIYGTTSQSGPTAHVSGGTIFELDTSTNKMSTLALFNGTAVNAGLLLAADGFVYGTTATGGAHGLGSVFHYDVTKHTITSLHDFNGTDGSNPQPGVLSQGSDGFLYGTTYLGGSLNFGTVFKIDPKNPANFTTLYEFSYAGRYPLGGVTEGGDGYIYGTTVSGYRSYGYGTIYRIDLSSNAFSTVAASPVIRSPVGNLLRANDGALYGVAQAAGTYGAIYKLSITQAVVIGQINIPTTAQIGVVYSGSVAASGGVGPLKWSATGLPTGVTLSTTGTLSGSPSLSGVFTPVFVVTEKNGNKTSITGHTINVTDFSMASSPLSLTVNQGASASYALTISAINGFQGDVKLSVSGLPVGANVNFTPSSVTGAGISNMTISTLKSTPKGTYVLTISATSGANKTAIVQLTVK